jgi:type IV pilus assembly protein PilV
MNNQGKTLLTSSPKKQLGLGIIEAMVSLLVISVGLLGIAALQLTSMQQTSGALWHSQAVWYSYEMTDRMNANRDPNTGNLLAAYGNIDTDNGYSQDCQGSACNQAQMAIADAADWEAMITTLPRGRGVISANANGSMMITVMWESTDNEQNCINGEDTPDGRTCYTITMD